VLDKFVQIECISTFRKGIEPAWEDPRNKNGGELHMMLLPQEQEELDSIYRILLAELVAENFKFAEHVPSPFLVS